ncbi:MAG: DEAD/DEAH box helicase [Microthrixaceae bacterium]|jgi:ATP-dependent RNA helicase DeaD
MNDMSPADEALPTDPEGFAALGLHESLLTALAGLGYEEPTPIQREAIPPIIEGRDLLGQAATGTGKTAAFALPILERLHRGTRQNEPVALVLVPTRELAMQVSEAIHKYGRAFDARVVPIYGGQPIVRQLQALKRGVDIVVATPGRAIDHIKRGTLPLDLIRLVVLDEADEMLDMGFAEDLEAILDATPADRQTVLFSATMPPRIGGLARRHLTDPVTIRIERETTEPGEAPRVRQVAYVVPRNHKAAALGRILDVEAPEAAIVFCRTRIEVDQLTETLNGRGYRAEGLHGGMSQEQRDRVMARVRNTTADLLIATDVAARGLDIDHLTHVVNYDVPAAPESYVHRIGRVGRAGREGIAITLAEPREHRLLKNIERVIKMQIPVEQVPTVADLRNRRMELTLSSLRETIMVDDLNQFRVIVDTLADEFDVVEVALAAIKLAHEATAGADDDAEEIPSVSLKPEKKSWEKKATHPGATTRGPGDKRRGGKDVGGSDAGRPKLQGRAAEEGFTRLFVGTGRKGGIRPQDLVGAICGETDLQGRQIGAIEITDNFSLVEVPSGSAEQVIKALGNTTIKGRKTSVRRERF